MNSGSVATGLWTGLAVLAFAANSVLGRLALRDGAMDPMTFTAIRVVSAAVTLMLLARARRQGWLTGGDRRGAAWLTLYAVPFALAYVAVEAGTGALLVFGAVQATMILAGMLRGERPTWREWLGFALALGGVAYLLLPGARAPSLAAGLSMAVAGIAWGLYSLHGRGAANPLAATTGNFVRAAPVVTGLWILSTPFVATRADLQTVLAALASGVLASALGYVVWYRALRGLRATRAALVQLLAPVLAAGAGVALLGEAWSTRLGLAALAVFGGVTLAALPRPRRP